MNINSQCINVHYNNTLMKVIFSSTETIMYWKFRSTYPLNLKRTHLLVIGIAIPEGFYENRCAVFFKSEYRYTGIYRDCHFLPFFRHFYHFFQKFSFSISKLFPTCISISPIYIADYISGIEAVIAQSVTRRTWDLEVQGSIPDQPNVFSP